jgi:uncharacterized membrane protein
VLAGLAALFVVVSYFPSGAAAQLFQPGRLGVAVGLWLRFVGSVVAAVAAAAATARGHRRASPAAAVESGGAPGAEHTTTGSDHRG